MGYLGCNIILALALGRLVWNAYYRWAQTDSLVIRSWAEENHLCQDPEYQVYMRAVPYSFFPKLF